jgi:cell division protein FtsI (penicillin-binding protein 3)
LVSSGRYVKRVRLRIALLGLASTLPVGALVGRLVYLQTVARASLQERAELQQQSTLKHDSTRGTIFDRHGRELAVSVEVESVYAVPSTVEDADATARALTSCLGGSAAKLAERLRSEKRFLWVKRKVSPGEADCVRELGLPEVNFLPEARRFYPKRGVAAHVLGFVGMDNEGMSGVEYASESDIRGEPGRQIIWMDARKRRAASRVEKSPLPGRDIYLTLDETLQHIADRSLERAVRETGSRRGMAILMRPETGEILAMTVAPGFNPNRYDAYPAARWRNRTVTDAYEPGSTFKFIPAAAALEEGVASEEERIDCGRGTIQVGDQWIRDHKTFDVLTFREVLEQSSNIGMIRIAQRLGKERLEHYVRSFGFGETTGVNLPGESRGLLRSASDWGPRTVASIAFGQEIGVTPLQMVTAVNAIAASGYLMRPRLVREVRSPEGDVLIGFEPEPVRRVVNRETAARMRDILVGVVERGTGKRAAVRGYRVAGKTGTAQKAEPGGGYSKTDFVASFAGFVPAERPELTALVILDSPSGDHSGARAAGVFADIVEPSLHYLGIPPREGQEINPVLARWPKPPGKAEPYDLRLRRPAASPAIVGSVPAMGELRMPALYGLSARDAVARIVAPRLVPELYGSGWVIGQDPPAGTYLGQGSRCTLILGPRRVQQSGEATRIVDLRRRFIRPNEAADDSVVVGAGSS